MSGSDSLDKRLISVVIPTYQRPDMLREAVESALIQDWRPLEIVVTDDSPDDASERMLRSLYVPDGIDVVYRRNPTPLRQAANVNQGFAMATGARLVLLHDDDHLLPGAVSTLARTYDVNPGVVAVYGRHRILAADGTDRGDELADLVARLFNRLPAFAGRQENALVSALRRQFPMNCYLLETGIARRIGYRPERVVGNACDTDFGIRLAMAAPRDSFFLIDDYVGEYRLSDTSVSRGSNSSSGSALMLERLREWKGLCDPEAEAARWDLACDAAVLAVTEHVRLTGGRDAFGVWSSREYGWRNRLRPRGWFHLFACAAPSVFLAIRPVVEATRQRRRRIRKRFLQLLGVDPAKPSRQGQNLQEPRQTSRADGAVST